MMSSKNKVVLCPEPEQGAHDLNMELIRKLMKHEDVRKDQSFNLCMELKNKKDEYMRFYIVDTARNDSLGQFSSVHLRNAFVAIRTGKNLPKGTIQNKFNRINKNQWKEPGSEYLAHGAVVFSMNEANIKDSKAVEYVKWMIQEALDHPGK